MGINDAVKVRYDDLICSKKKMMGLGNLFSSLVREGSLLSSFIDTQTEIFHCQVIGFEGSF